MKAFVTGGTGFIGSRLVKKLLERDYQVNALVRSQSSATDLQAQGATPVLGDITSLESMREGMRGCDVVFHLAAWYKLGASDWRKAEAINVDGTRNVLSLAHQSGIPKIIYTSTVAVFGDTHGFLADETYVNPGDKFLTEYDRTKWLAQYQVARPMIEKGAPIVIVMPGGVYGPGDPSLVGDIMRAFYKGLLFVFPGPELTLTYAHVGDIAEGHILAAEKGKPGESYLLAGQVMSLGEIVKIWAEVSGKRRPLFHIPGRFLKPLAPVVGAISSLVPLPPMISRDALAIQGATYIARSDKARAELGWEARPLEEGMRETFAWIAGTK
jgi:dihydroflavonol-4-reductase